MNFEDLTINRLLKDEEQFSVSNRSYILSYPEFLKYFESIELIEKHHLIVSAHFVYGWMPTIINIDFTDIETVLSLLNRVRSGYELGIDDFLPLKTCVNNSMVGLSKLLHFINPSDYAIWDSNIYRYITGTYSLYKISQEKNYLKYLLRLKEISQHADYWSLHQLIQSHFEYAITPMRAIEVLMYESGRKNH